MIIWLCFGDPVWQKGYDPDTLSDADRQRVGAVRAARAEQDWQVSRAVATWLRGAAGRERNAPVALSHCRGHALAGLAPPDCVLGVDIERCSSRDVDALARWVCSSEEAQFLAALHDRAEKLRQFYVLWTLKESMLKAANLPFPAGMAHIGLDGAGTAHACLRAPEGRWEAMVWQLSQDWLAAAAWQPALAGAETARVRWLPGVEAQLVGHWRSPE